MEDDVAAELRLLRAEIRAGFARMEALLQAGGEGAAGTAAGGPTASTSEPGSVPNAVPRERTVYTDGACAGNGRADSPGGWAFVFGDGESASGGEDRTTNQRMELRAAIEALKRCAPGQAVAVCSDSAYLVNCFRDRWYVRWERSGWVNSQREPVANQDLWRELLDLARERRVEWRKVEGHRGDVLNERADRLAVAAIPKGPERRG